jgi:hypothetical protein
MSFADPKNDGSAQRPASVRLIDVRDAITALHITEPWGFTGADFIETLSRVDTRWGPVDPPFALDLELEDPFLLVDHVGHVPECGIEGFRTLHERWRRR